MIPTTWLQHLIFYAYWVIDIRGVGQNRTDDHAFAEQCLTAWLQHLIFYAYWVISTFSSSKTLSSSLSIQD